MDEKECTAFHGNGNEQGTKDKVVRGRGVKGEGVGREGWVDTFQQCSVARQVLAHQLMQILLFGPGVQQPRRNFWILYPPPKGNPASTGQNLGRGSKRLGRCALEREASTLVEVVFTPKFEKYILQNVSSELVRIGGIIIFHLSKL